MEDRGLDCLLITGNNSIWERGWANIRWVSNFMGTMELDCTCVFPLVGDPMLAILASTPGCPTASPAPSSPTCAARSTRRT